MRDQFIGLQAASADPKGHAVLDGRGVVTRGSIIFNSETRGTFGLVGVGVSATLLLPTAAALRLNRIVFSSVMVLRGAVRVVRAKSGCDVL